MGGHLGAQRNPEGRPGPAGVSRAMGGMGGHLGAQRNPEGRPGSAGVSRAMGGMGGHLGAQRNPEGRPGSAGVSRALGGMGGHLGAPHVHSFLSWGSSPTRSPSPKSWVASTIRRMHAPGNTVSHHWPAISVGRASESMRPPAGSGGGTPTPRKESDASAMMTTPTVRLASTVAVVMTFGRMWRVITRHPLAPAL